MTNQKTLSPDARLSIWERISYGCGLGGIFFVYYMPACFMTFYYTDVLKLDPAIIGTIMLLSRLFDGFTDIAAGTIFDRTRSKLGKSRAWVLFLCVPFVISLVLAYSVPTGWTTVMKYAYVFVSYNVMLSVMFTAINLPLLCQPALLTTNAKEHSYLGIFGQAIGTLPLLVVNHFTLKLVSKFGDTPRAWTITVGIYAVIALILCLINFFGTTERVDSDSTDAQGNRIPLAKRIYVLLSSKSWLAFTVAGIFFDIALCICSGARIYYAKVLLNNSNAYTSIANYASWAQFLGLVFVSYFLVKTFGNSATFRVGAFLVLVGSALQLITSSMVLVAASNIIVGIGFAGMLCTQYACNADLAGHLSEKAGFSVVGLASTGATFGAKVGNGFGSFLLGLFLKLGMYDEAATAYGANTMNWVNAAYIWTPVVCSIIVILLMRTFYDVDKKEAKA